MHLIDAVYYMNVFKMFCMVHPTLTFFPSLFLSRASFFLSVWNKSRKKKAKEVVMDRFDAFFLSPSLTQ